MWEVKFKNQTYLIANENDDAKEGSMATREQFQGGYMSYAHVEGGRIWRLGKIIGSADDLEFIRQVYDDRLGQD